MHKYPAYGRQLMEMRMSGKIPARSIKLVFDWDLARAHARIVITDQTPVNEWNFSFLAGLPVEIIYRRKDAHRISYFIDAVLEVDPSFLSTFAMDLISTGGAVTIIKPFEHTQIAEAA